MMQRSWTPKGQTVKKKIKFQLYLEYGVHDVEPDVRGEKERETE